MTDKVWKKRERAVARALQGKRIPLLGERHGADVETTLLCVQVKHGRRRPAFLKDWLDGICSTAKAKDKIGLVVWSDRRERTQDAIVLLKLSGFQALHGDVFRS